MNLHRAMWIAGLTIIPLGVALAAAEPRLKIGDLAPQFTTGRWVQGEPVKEFEKGKAYIVEFWATWCGPCRVSIPHLNGIHEKYKDKGLVVIGQDCWEKDDALVKPFVTRMGDKMAYRVSLDDKQESKVGKMAETWMQAAGRNGIPTAFLVDAKGVVAWIGHPMQLQDSLIEEVLAGKFDVEKAARDYAERESKQARLQEVWQAINRAIRAKQWEEASTDLDELSKLLPQEDRLTRDMLRLDILLGKGDTDQAQGLMARISEANLQNPGLQNRLALLLLKDKSIGPADLALAESFANRANDAAEGKQAFALDTLARVDFMLGKIDQAVAAEEKAVVLAEGEPKTVYQTALRHYRRGESPDAAKELTQRAGQEAATGKWREAAGDFANLVEQEPEEYNHQYALGAILMQLNDVTGYEKFRHKVVEQFGTTRDPVMAERLAKDCLILPCNGPILEQLSQMADTSVTLGKDNGYFIYFEFAKALAEYRAGHFDKAVEWCHQVLEQKDGGFRDAETYAVLAMANYHLNQQQESMFALAKGAELVDKLPNLDSGNVGEDFIDVIISNALEHEAKSLIQSGDKVAKIKQ